MAKKRFKAKVVGADAMRRRATQSSVDYDSIFDTRFSKFKVTEGSYKIRILPIPEDSPRDYYGMDIFCHYDVGPDSATYLCLKEMKGEDCPICEERRKAQDDGDDDYAYKLAPKKRVLFWIIDRAAERKSPTGPMLWDMPWTVDRDITDRCYDDSTGETLNITDVYEGYDVSFTREGKGLRTKYIGIDIARKPSPLSDDDDEIEEWLDFIEKNPLESVLNFYDYDYIAKEFGGGGGSSKRGSRNDRDEDEDEEEEQSARSRIRSRVRESKNEDDEDEDDSAPFDVEEEDEDAAPARRRGRRVEEEEEEEGEEEEEEAPRRRSSSKSNDVRERLRSRRRSE